MRIDSQSTGGSDSAGERCGPTHSFEGRLWLSVWRGLLEGPMGASVPVWMSSNVSSGGRRKDLEAPLGLKGPNRKLVAERPSLGG